MPDVSPPLPKLPAAHAKRLAWALNAYGHLLAAAVKHDTSQEARKVAKLPDEQVPDHVARLIQDKADPTVAKTMTGWLVRQYAERAFRLEDLGTAYETLDMFHRYALRLPKGEQDLGRYPSLARVWEAVSPIAEAEQDKLSGKAQKALERDKAYGESRILRQDPDGFTVAVPLTEFAAKWWGRGTRWCTAAEKDNQFWEYHKDAPLIVVVIPELKEKGKFQIWATEYDVQFMDATDEEVAVAVTEANWGRFETIIQAALMQNGWTLKWVPEHLRTEELCEIAVERTGVALLFVPESLRNEELCRMAVTQEGIALEYVPEKLCTLEICEIAVEKNGMSLGYVPIDFQTPELCRIAVGQNGRALFSVPWSLRTSDLCRIAVEKNGAALAYVPEPLRTPELCRIAVAQEGEALQILPGALRSAELCQMAVEQNGLALCWVPKHLKTVELCRIAVQNSFAAIDYVPTALELEMPPRPEKSDSTPTWPIMLLDDLERAMAEKPPLIVQNHLCFKPNNS